MAIYNFGSINIDHFYALPKFPEPGETLNSTQYSFGLGGKGANQSIASARAGASVTHIGHLNKSDTWIKDKFEQSNID